MEAGWYQHHSGKVFHFLFTVLHPESQKEYVVLVPLHQTVSDRPILVEVQEFVGLTDAPSPLDPTIRVRIKKYKKLTLQELRQMR